MKNDWISRLKDRMEHYEEPAQTPTEDAALWEGILSRIQPPKRKRLPVLWLLAPVMGAAACLLILWLLYRPDSSLVETDPAATLATAPHPQEVLPVFTSEEPMAESKRSPSTTPPLYASAAHPHRYLLGSPLAADEVHLPIGSSGGYAGLHPALLARVEGLPVVRPSSPSMKEGGMALPRPSRQSPRLRASLLASNVSGTGTSIGGYGRHYSVSLPAPEVLDLPSDREIDSEKKTAHDLITLFNQTQETLLSVRRHPPLRVGLMVGYEVAKGLFVESGLLYTREETELRQGSESYYTDTRYTDQLLGVPLTLRWDFVDHRRWSVHLAGTLLGEVPLASSIQTDYHMGREVLPSERTASALTGDPLQWSVRGALGVRYELTDRLGLYLEPGVTRQITTLPRLYNEVSPRPLYLDAVLGLSLQF